LSLLPLQRPTRVVPGGRAIVEHDLSVHPDRANPNACACGVSNVARPAIVAGSNSTRSAKYPGLIDPRFAMHDVSRCCFELTDLSDAITGDADIANKTW